MKRAIQNYFLARQHSEEDIEWYYPDNRLSTVIEGLERPLVIVNGAFDLLSAAHMRLIFAARDHAKSVVCLLDSDEKIRLGKGEDRPVMKWFERLAALRYMPIDEFVEIRNDEDFVRAVEIIRPDFRVLGGDHRYQRSRIPGVPTIFVRDSQFHNSDLIERIRCLS